MPMMYLGMINAYYWTYASFWDGMAKLRLAKPLQRHNAPKEIMQKMAQMSAMKKKQMEMETNGGVKVNHVNGTM